MSKYTPHPPLSIYGKGNVLTIVVNIPFVLSIAEKTLLASNADNTHVAHSCPLLAK